MKNTEPGLLAISASFTAEPVAASLEFWLHQSGPETQAGFAPFAQIFQTLLEPGTIFAGNRRGVNVVLLRWEDLGEENRFADNGRELIRTLKHAAGRFAVPLLVSACPASPHFASAGGHAEILRRLNEELHSELSGVAGVYLLAESEITSWYPVSSVLDETSERLGHVPYTAEYFAALGTALARKYAALNRAPYKVAVLDLDNTLWKGVAGEDGATGLVFSEARLRLHRFLKEQRESGMLLAICSKNNEEDVREIFRARPEMPLALEDFAATRINWSPKSENLRSLAAELSLGLNSFLFLDDDRKECAEVEANCPEVLTLLLPDGEEELPEFLNHVWAFDRLKVTEEDRQRNASYRQERERVQFSSQAQSLEAFVAGLELRVVIQQMAPEQLARVAQLTNRTNQFNTTAIRRTEPEVEAYAATPGQGVYAVTVSDRFGDYGLVGAVFYRNAGERLVLDSFLLSCRALGRGVEQQIIRHLGGTFGLALEIPFVPTKKNSPAQLFLAGTGAVVESGAYVLTAKQAQELEYRPGVGAAAASAVQEEKAPAAVNLTAKVAGFDYAYIANRLRTPAEILAAVRESRQGTAGTAGAATDLPRTERETQLAAIWADTLGVPSVGIHDDFFEAGGDSLLAVELLRQVIETFGDKGLTLTAVLGAPSVAQFAELLEQTDKPKFQCLVPLRENQLRPRLFCIHGAGGNIVSMRSLAMNLPESQPFWGIQAKGLDGSEPGETVEETAALYIREIKQLQPTGPYFIAGGSYGGLFAYEMGQQLRAQGDNVPMIMMFDTYNLAFGQMIPKSRVAYAMARFAVKRGLRQLGRLGRSPVSKWPELIGGALGAARRHAGKLLGSVTSGPQNESQPLPAGPLTAANDDTGLNEVLIRVRDATMRAAERYLPKPYGGDVTIFAATIKMVEPYEDKYLGWRPLVKGKLSLETIPGDHVTMGDEQAFADALDRVLRRAQESAASAGASPMRPLEPARSVAG